MKKLWLSLLAVSGIAYAQVQIGNLPPATLPLSGTEKVALAQTGTGCPAPGCTRQTPVSSFISTPTNLTQGTGITLTPNPITGTGTVALTVPVTVSTGGTGQVTLPVHSVLLGEGTGNVGNVSAMAVDTLLQGQGATVDPAAVSLPNCGSALSYSTSTHLFGCQTPAGTPGGANTNVQFNNSGAFGGANDFSWITGTDTMLLGSTSLAPTITTNTTTATGTGIALTVSSGTGGSTSGNAGAINLKSGSAASNSTVTSGNGGALNILAGRGALNTGSGSPTGVGGAISITAGMGAATVSGTAPTAADGGAITITGGSPDNSNGSSGNGGAITITGGESFGFASAKTGGTVTVQGGTGGAGGDTPGAVTVVSGSGGGCGVATFGVGSGAATFTNLQFDGSPAGCDHNWRLGPAVGTGVTGDLLTGTSAGGVQLGAPTGGDCGAGCFAAQSIKIQGVPVTTGGGTTFTLGTGTGACATTSTLTGGPSVGSFLCTGTAGASTQVVNLPTTAHGWACHASDVTSGTVWAQSASSTTSCTLKGTIATTSDQVIFGAMAF
jgi:hypothetical protein